MIKLMKRFLGAYKTYAILGPLCKLVEVIFELLTPVVVAKMIDEGVGQHDLSIVIHYGIVLVVFAVVSIAFTLVCQKMAALASQGVGTDIRSALYQHINEFSYAEIDRFGTPSLITRITNDVNQVQLGVSISIRMLTRWPFLAIGSIVAALLIDVKLGVIFLIAMPVIAVVFYLVLSKCVPFFTSMQEKLDRIGQLTREGLSGMRVIRAFVREERERERFRDAAEDQMDISIAVGKLTSLLNPATFLVMNLAVCAILWMGGLQVDTGALTQGEVMAFVNYMTQTLNSILYLANMVVILTKASASAARINEVLDCEPSVTDEGNEPVAIPGTDVGKGAQTAAVPAGSVVAASAGAVETAPAEVSSFVREVPALRMDGATFAFADAGANAVEGATLELACGQTLGVIGGTGSGKSTLVNLIPRLYDVMEGSVEVLGTDVREWPLSQLRHVVGLVPQKAELVSGTIASNLRWRDEDATEEELWRALDVAQASDFVRALPEGIETTVEAGGKNFSGGQRQRLTIARALVGDPLLLILDDSASALDFKTDAALRRAIHARSRDGARAGELPLTTVIVSQRVSSVRDADLICVMRRGKVVGLGTHGELLRTCPVYEEICLSQLKREELEGVAA